MSVNSSVRLQPGLVHVRTSLIRPVLIAIGLIAAGVLYLGLVFGWRQASLFMVGAGAGLVLYHSAFGFTSAWRAAIAEGRGSGLRAQMLMLAVTSVIFLPLLADGQVFGRLVRGTVAPIGMSVVVGANDGTASHIGMCRTPATEPAMNAASVTSMRTLPPPAV